MLNAIVRRLAALEAIRMPRRKKTKADVEAAFCRAAGTTQLSAVQQAQCDALWDRIQEQAKVDPYIRGLFASEVGQPLQPAESQRGPGQLPSPPGFQYGLGEGTTSSSDGQRFGIQADSLLAAPFYPR
jgi:hypothetical protein